MGGNIKTLYVKTQHLKCLHQHKQQTTYCYMVVLFLPQLQQSCASRRAQPYTICHAACP